MQLAFVDWAVLGLYVAFVLAIGWFVSRRTKSGSDFFLAGRSIPAWICGLAFISANLGAQEVIGMAASGAKYGIATAHFYWVGAIPAMVFVGLFMMPFYYGSKARSVAGVPEAALRREDPRLQRHHLRGDDRLLLRHLHVRHGQADPDAARAGRAVRRWACRRAGSSTSAVLVSAVVVLVYIYLGRADAARSTTRSCSSS